GGFVTMTVALVTGASRGIGRACALELAAQGYKVALNYSKDESGANQTARSIEAAGGKAQVFKGDVSVHEEAHVLVDRVEKELGPIQVLVLNAGMTKDALLVRMSEDDWTRVLDVNLKGVYN